jgi:hypothetical protein
MNRDANIRADEVVVISLPERHDRRILVEELFPEEQIPFHLVDGLSVTHGEISDREVAELELEDFKLESGWDSYLQVAMGCHYANFLHAKASLPGLVAPLYP